MKRFFLKLSGSFLAAVFLLNSPISFLYSEEPEKISDQENRSAFDATMLAGPLGGSSVKDAQQARITLELKGVDILDVLKLISQRSELNIVAGKNVRGPVTLYLKNVLIQDALDTVINSLDLAYVEESGGIINVMTSKEFEDLYGRSFGKSFITKAIQIRYASPAAVNQVMEKLKSPKGKIVLDERTNTLVVTDRSESVAEIEKAVAQFDRDLVTKVFQLTFARAEDFEAQIKDYLTPQTGVVKIDKRTNQVTVTDRAEKIRQIHRLVRELDIRPKQVLIQAQVIAVELFDAFRYGIDWEYVRSRMGEFRDVNFQPTFNLAAPNADNGSGSLSTFTFEDFHGLSSVVSLLQNVGKTNTLSSPRITVINNEEAKLVDATRQPYISQTVVQGETTSQTADNIQFVDVGVTLTVVPTIADDERIVLKLKPEVSTQTGTLDVESVAQGSNTTFTRSSIPIVSSQTLETTVVVKSGETLVVGGLIKDNESKLRRKLPVVSDIPVIGALFRSEQVDFNKTELVIFLTPHIVPADSATKEHNKYFNPKGELINFDLVGGYDYAKALKHSQGALRLDHDPYWEQESVNFPNYFSPGDIYERSDHLKDHVNEFEPCRVEPSLEEKQSEEKNYRSQIQGEIDRRLETFRLQVKEKTTADLALKVSKDGVIQDLSWIDARQIKKDKLKRKMLRAIQDAGKLPPFPAGLDSEGELIALSVTLEPQS